MHNIARFFLKCLLLVLRGIKVLKICWLGQKFLWKKKKPMRNLVVRENTVKFALFLIGNTFTSKGGSDPQGVRGVFISVVVQWVWSIWLFVGGVWSSMSGVVLLQSLIVYLRLTLVFMWNGALREKFNFCFSKVFC